MQQRYTLVTLGTADLKRARAFYEALGWRSRAGEDDDVVFFQTGNSVLALWDRESLAEDSGVPLGEGFGGVALAYNVNSPAEVDEVIAEAEAAGRGSHARPRRRSEVAMEPCSWIPMAIRGRWPTIRIGRSVRRQRDAARLSPPCSPQRRWAARRRPTSHI